MYVRLVRYLTPNINQNHQVNDTHYCRIFFLQAHAFNLININFSIEQLFNVFPGTVCYKTGKIFPLYQNLCTRTILSCFIHKSTWIVYLTLQNNFLCSIFRFKCQLSLVVTLHLTNTEDICACILLFL